jgi:hypothetical protein
VILVSDNGHNITWGQTWDSALAEILEAGATLYGIQLPNPRPGKEVRNALSLAADTGGEILNVGTGRSLTKALDQSIANLCMQYTIGFTPSNPKRDGAYHRLDVRLRDGRACPRCKLSARKGYYAGTMSPGSPVYVDREIRPGVKQVDSRAYSRMTLAAADIEELNGIPFDADAAWNTAPGLSNIGVRLNIEPAAVTFRTERGLRIAKLYVTIFHGLAGGAYQNAVWKILDLSLKEETYREMMTFGIPFADLVVAGREDLNLKIVVYDPQGQNIGSRQIRVSGNVPE